MKLRDIYVSKLQNIIDKESLIEILHKTIETLREPDRYPRGICQSIFKHTHLKYPKVTVFIIYDYVRQFKPKGTPDGHFFPLAEEFTEIRVELVNEMIKSLKDGTDPIPFVGQKLGDWLDAYFKSTENS